MAIEYERPATPSEGAFGIGRKTAVAHGIELALRLVEQGTCQVGKPHPFERARHGRVDLGPGEPALVAAVGLGVPQHHMRQNLGDINGIDIAAPEPRGGVALAPL